MQEKKLQYGFGEKYTISFNQPINWQGLYFFSFLSELFAWLKVAPYFTSVLLHFSGPSGSLMA
jgi:hypothetical protein